MTAESASGPRPTVPRRRRSVVRRWTWTGAAAAATPARKWPSSCPPCTAGSRTRRPGPRPLAQSLRSVCPAAARSSGTRRRRTGAGSWNSAPSRPARPTNRWRSCCADHDPLRCRRCADLHRRRRPPFPAPPPTDRPCSGPSPNCASWPPAPSGTAGSAGRCAGTLATPRNRCLPATVPLCTLSGRSWSTRSATRTPRDLHTHIVIAVKCKLLYGRPFNLTEKFGVIDLFT